MVFAITGSLLAAAGCLIAGIFVDIDHLLEFFLFSQKKFSIKNFLNFYRNLHYKKAFVLLHSYELLAVLWLVSVRLDNIMVYGLMLGYTVHMVFDMIFNPVYWYGYFLSFRLFTGFNKEKFIDEELHFKKHPDAD